MMKVVAARGICRTTSSTFPCLSSTSMSVSIPVLSLLMIRV
jgi:hypothetical protein